MLRFGLRPVWLYFIALSAALTLPILAVAGYTMWGFAKSERAQLENNVYEVNQQILFAVERQHGADIAALRTLATSPALRDDNIAAFDLQAVSMIESIPAFTGIVLRNADGQILMDRGFGFGRDLPAGFSSPEQAPPEVSGIVTGKTFEQSAYYISAPVIVAGKVRYYVIARLVLSRLAGLMKEQMVDDGYFATVVDSNGIILARSTESEKFFGRKLNGLAGPVSQSFTWSGINPEGVAVYGIVTRCKSMGWSVTTGISQKLLHAPLQRSLAWLAALGLITFAAGCVIAYLLSRVLSNAACKIIAAAVDLGEGRQVSAFSSPVAEANIVGTALQSASEKLCQNAEALNAANRTLERKVEERTAELGAKTALLETTLSNMDQGLIVVGADAHIRLFNENASSFLNIPADFLGTLPTIADMIRYCRAAGHFDTPPADVQIMLDRVGLVPGETQVHEREMRDGKVIEVRTVPLADGSLVRTYTDVTLRKHAERHLHHIARHDSLTQLPNRLLFRERLEQAIAYHERHGAPFSVLCVDLDHFKAINDRYGHDVGDGLLRAVSARLKSALRMEDTVARIGGDEFAILQTGTGTLGEPIRLARRLIEAAAEAYRIGDIDIVSGLSIGIARCPEHGDTAETLLKKADIALYRAKNLGRGRFHLASNDDMARKAG